MNNDDLPIEMDFVNEDLPLDTSGLGVKTRPKSINDMHLSHAAVLKSELEEISVYDAYDGLDTSRDPKSQVDELAFLRSEQEQKELRDYFNDNLGSTPEEVYHNSQVYESLIAEEKHKQSSPERQVVESFSGLSPDEQDLLRNQATLELINTITDIADNYSVFEKALDIGKGFLPLSIVDNKEISGTFFGAESFLRDVVIGLKDLRRNDPEKFQRILPVLVDSLQEELPKNKQLTVLAAILNPRGEEELGDFSAAWAAFDALEIATLGAATALKIAKLTKSINAIKLAKNLDNTDLATDVNTSALIEDTGAVAEKAGIDRITAHANAAPFNVSTLDESYAGGLSAESVARIAAVKAQQQRVSEIIRSGEGLLKESVLTPAERLAAETRFGEQLRSEGIDDFSIVSRTDDATKFRYRMVTEKTGKPMVRKGQPVYAERDLDLTLDDVTGTWKNTEKGMIASYLKSPTAIFSKWTHDKAPDISRQAIRMDSTSSNIGEMFQVLQTEALRPMLGRTGIKAFSPKIRRELAELDDVLRAGDEWKDPSGVRGKVFSVEELKGGNVGGVKLNDRQIETYYNLRNLYDELWVIRNDETRNLMKAQGKKEVTVANTPQVGKPYTRDGATAIMNKEGKLSVYDSTKDEIIDLTGKDITKLYSEGKVLSKLDEEIKIPNGNHGDALYDLVITSDKSVQGLPDKVLSFRQGYVPKINVGAYWFVKRLGTKTVNGKSFAGQPIKTERMFASKTEADQWLSGLDPKERDQLTLLPDRALEQQVMGSSQVGSGGGLYTGARSFEDIPFGADGVPTERLNTYEALGHNLQSLENYVTRNQWRLAQQQRWVNSARAAGFDVDRFEKGLIPDSDPRGKGLKKLADQIEIWSGFPTASEQRWDGFVSSVMEWALNSRFVPLSNKAVVRGANYLRHRNNNPVNVVRNTAFHSLLGVFNPAQLWVQAQGAALAASIMPTKALKVFRMQNALATASHFGTDSAVTKTVAKAALVDPTELEQLIKLWNKTGLESSVNNTADYVAASRGLGVGREALRKGFDKGLFFYRMGELFNRRYSFIMAAERAKASGKINDLENVTDVQLKDILADANNLMLNLSRANRASWQRGVVSIPTQFLQVQAKLLETMVGANKSFTLRERGKILAGQLALYGAAGIPLGNFATRFIQESVGISQQEVENLPPTAVTAINDGLWGVFAYTWLGADVDMSNRGAIANGMMEFTLDLMFSEATIGEKAIGAFGMVPHRTFDAWKQIKPMVLNKSDAPMTDEELMIALRAVGRIASTWNNAEKGYFMSRFHQLNDSRGNAVVRNENFNVTTEFMAAIGFQPSELKRVRDRDTLTRSRKEYRTKVTDALVDHFWNYTEALKNADNDKEIQDIITNYNYGTQYWLSSLRNEGEIQQVRQALNTRLQNMEDAKTRSIRQFLEEFSDSQVLSMGSLIASMRAKGLIQNDVSLPDEDEIIESK